MKSNFFFFLLFFTGNTLITFAQIHSNIQIPTSINEDGAAPHNSAILDINSANQGLLIPRMDSAARDLITTPATGLLVFQTDDTPGFYYYDGVEWVNLKNLENQIWRQSGNAAYYLDGSVGIGTEFPADFPQTTTLDIRGDSLDAGGTIMLNNEDASNFLMLFSGRATDRNPFIAWKGSDRFRLFSFDDPWDPITKFIVDTTGFVGIHTNDPAAQLDVGGRIKVSDDNSTPAPGTIRWTGLDFEGWNGVYWVSLTASTVVNIVNDADGNEYRTMHIGTQEWMIENLRTTHYNDGMPIPLVEDDAIWGILGGGAYCWYNNDPSVKNPYGALYNWYALETEKLCPTGWRIPVTTDWELLENSLGDASIAGGKMKEAGTSHWMDPNAGASNESGFTGLPAGIRSNNGIFELEGSVGYYWVYDPGVLSYTFRALTFGSEGLSLGISLNPIPGYSVRCVKNE